MSNGKEDFFDKYFTTYSGMYNIPEGEQNVMVGRLRGYLAVSGTGAYRFAYQGDYWFEFSGEVLEPALREKYMLNEIAINLDGEKEWAHLPSVLRECRCTICDHQNMYECYKARPGDPATVSGFVSRSGCTCCMNDTTHSGFTDAPCN